MDWKRKNPTGSPPQIIWGALARHLLFLPLSSAANFSLIKCCLRSLLYPFLRQAWCPSSMPCWCLVNTSKYSIYCTNCDCWFPCRSFPCLLQFSYFKVPGTGLSGQSSADWREQAPWVSDPKLWLCSLCPYTPWVWNPSDLSLQHYLVFCTWWALRKCGRNVGTAFTSGGEFLCHPSSRTVPSLALV